MHMEPFNSGLNNQKLSLLGYYLTALKNEVSALPLEEIYDFIPGLKNIKIRFNKVFNEADFIEVIEKYGLNSQARTHLIQNHDPIKMFRVGASALSHINSLSERERKFIHNFLNALTPCPGLFQTINDINDQVSGALVLQLRIENNWIRYMKSKNLMPCEMVPLDPNKIFKKISESDLLRGKDQIYACCDEDDLPLPHENIKKIARNYGLNIFFKRDLLESKIVLPKSRILLSMIDFTIAMKATHYVGLTRSTFSNVLAFTRNYGQDSKANHLIYNKIGFGCHLRTDDGISIDPATACKSSV